MATRNLVNRDKPSFKQQNLPAWQPILTAGTVLPTFFLIGVAFVPIGIGLLMSSTAVQEIMIPYTDCISKDSNLTCAYLIQKEPHDDCKCSIEFNLDQDFRKDVYVYYRLSNFYQNHRRYVKSRDDVQLLGNPMSASSDCYPFSHREVNGKLMPIAPCGAIANSKFNDTFEITSKEDDKKITLSKSGIAWPSDKNIRFRNPPIPYGKDLKAAFDGTTHPPNWKSPVYELEKYEDNNGFQNEALIVWMRTAALPTFRKLYAIVGGDRDFLPRGKYELLVNYNYPVKMFDGQKDLIISNTSWLGGKNNFLGIAYIVVGGICFIISAFFLYIHKKFGRLPSEIIQINQATPYLAT